MLGLEQGRNAAAQLLDLIIANVDAAGASSSSSSSSSSVYFYSSPFARAIETARACLVDMTKSDDDGDGGGGTSSRRRAREAGLTIREGVTLHDGLMERYFGRLDGMALSTYAYVWPNDMFDPTHTAFDVESVAAVSTRLRATVLDIDSRHTGGGGGDHIVLASHADVLQILQVYAAGLDNVGEFSQYRFGNGEVRTMGRVVGSLPKAVPLEPPKRGE